MVDDFPMAEALSVEPDLASYFDTTPEDHLLADLVATLRALTRVIEKPQTPISYHHATLPAAGDSEVIRSPLARQTGATQAMASSATTL